MTSSRQQSRVSSQKLAKFLSDSQSGSQSALAALLNVYRPYLLATAATRLNKALKAKVGPSDLVQETMTQAFQSFKNLDEQPANAGEVRVWLRNILLERLKAVHRRYYRAKRRFVGRERSLDEGDSKQLVAQLAKHAETPAALVDQKLLVERLESRLDRLSPAYKQIIVWRDYDGRQFADIAKQLDRSPDAARMLWNRAMRQLKKELGM